MLKRVDFLLWVLIAVVSARLLSMTIVPLTDTTEARYGEIARIMAETGDFITPWFDYGVPFWGKPPLSFWTEAIAFKLFGVTEFAARLPSWLATLTTTWLIYTTLQTFAQRHQAIMGAAIYSTMILTYVMSGAVLTDPFLTLGTTLALVSFLLTLNSPLSNWRWYFFIGLAIGLLSKGPLALVLTGTPIFIWLVWQRQWHQLRHLPWFRGTLLTAILTLPWYIAAELKTPGFINYFIVGEHFLRFIDSGWQGDLYGSAHKQAHGVIWIHWLVATLPWGIIALYHIIKHWFIKRSTGLGQLDNMQRLLLLAALFPGMFFTLSGNILWTYQLPALAPLALLMALIIYKDEQSISQSTVTTILAIPLIILIAGLYINAYPDKLKSEKSLVAYYNAHRADTISPLIYLDKTPFSARYYSRGQAQHIALTDLLQTLRTTDAVYYCAVPNNAIDATLSTLSTPAELVFQNKRYGLLRVISTVNKQ